MTRRSRNLLVVLAALLAPACAPAAPPAATPAPEVGKRVVAEHAVVSAASPLAAEAGLEMLRRGGNAVDAAIATAFAVGVVEPQMSGLGGGGSLLLWLQDEQRAEHLDFYASQPAAPFWSAAEPDTGTADLQIVAVPGAVAGWLEAHQRFGRLPRAVVLQPAIRLADQGFAVNPVLAGMIAGDSAKLARFPESAAALLPGNRPLGAGELLRQPELAATLRRVAEQGSDGFYRGPIAEQVVRTLNRGGHPVTPEQFAAFEPQWKRPLCGEFLGRLVLSAPPPQSGAQVIHTLEMLERHDLPALGLPTREPAAFDVLASALRVGIADHRGNQDPRWVAVPAVGLASEAFARERAALVGAGRAPERVEQADAAAHERQGALASGCAPLRPWAPAAAMLAESGADAKPEDEGGETTHISVVDADGNAVALTQTNSSLFGSGARVAGFFLNNSAYRFDDEDRAAGMAHAWRTRRSTIAPTVVLRDGRVEMVVGAPGGGRIPTAIAQNMVYVLAYGMDPLEAVRMPRMFPAWSTPQVQLEHGYGAGLLRDVRAMGYKPAPLSSGYARMYMIVRRDGHWIGVADPRHDGGAVGY